MRNMSTHPPKQILYDYIKEMCHRGTIAYLHLLMIFKDVQHIKHCPDRMPPHIQSITDKNTSNGTVNLFLFPANALKGQPRHTL